MPTVPQLFSRSSDDSSNSLNLVNPIYAIGIAITVAAVLGVGIWLALRFYRQRMARKRESKMGAAFLSVKGLVREDSMFDEKDPFGPPPPPSAIFSRNQLNSTIILPEKTLSRPSLSREEIVSYHRQSGNYPTSFSPRSPGSLRPPRSPFLETSFNPRDSTFSVASSHNRFSVISGLSSSDVTSTSGTARKVRQLFDPILPDELLLTRLGEHLTIVQSFDDGWCVVGRESATAALVQSAKSLFKSTPAADSNIELGVVPTWCFLKPAKGLRAERPVRSSSLGVTVNLDIPSSRNDLVSWSNF